ncbi:MAG: LptF/LptG family permease [Desulfobacteraceae bacterium]|nr:LptF/LptG family permease [Desulfobacteraceae bacterium]
MTRTLNRYLLREQALPILICMAVVSFILVTGQLFQLKRILFASSCSMKDVAEIIVLAMPKLFLYATPMAALLGVMLAFMRLNGDNELIALRSVGIGFLHLLPPVLAVLLFVTAAAFINAIFVIPVANAAFEMKLKSLGRSSIPSLLKEGSFISTIPNLVFLFRSVDHAELTIKGVFIQDQRHPNERVTIDAESAQVLIPPDSKSITFKITNGVITRTGQDMKDAQAVSFKNYDFTLSMDDVVGAAEKGIRKKREMNLTQLYEQVQHLTGMNQAINFKLELHQRLAFPSACLLLGLLGPPLGSFFRQRARMTGVTMGVTIFLLYYVILSAGKGLGESDIISPFFAVWTPNLLSFALAIFLWRKLHTETPFGIPVLAAKTARLFRSGTKAADVGAAPK